MDITEKNIVDEQSRMRTDRNNYDKMKELCISLAYPGRVDCMDYYNANAVGKPNTHTHRVYDATAFRGLDIWANGILGYYMPKDFIWFSEQMSAKELRDSKAIRNYLQEIDEQMRQAISVSNFYEQMPVYIKDAGGIGDAFMFIEKDENEKLMMLAPHPREFFITRDYWGRVIKLHHLLKTTLKKMADEFGMEALNEEQRRRLKESPDTPVEMIHSIWKNSDYNPSSIAVKDMLWQHRYLNCSGGTDGNGKIIRKDGSDTLNPVPWSMNRPSNENYGRGIVSQILIEILNCNLIAKTMGKAAQQSVEPTTLITSALRNKLKTHAGAINFVNSEDMSGLKMGDLVTRLFDTSAYPFGVENQQRWQQMVDERFGVTLFLALNSSEKSMTLGEARMKQAEKIILMTPLMATIGTTTDMIFDRIFALEEQEGRLPAPPDELIEAMEKSGRGKSKINIQYVGPLTQMLKQYYDVGNLLNVIENIRQVAAEFPESKIVVEGDELMRKILAANNTPETLIRDKQVVDELRAIAAQEAEVQQQAAMAAQASKIVPNLSKRIEQDSILSQLQKAA